MYDELDQLDQYIKTNDNGDYIMINGLNSDYDIAALCGLDYLEYRDILQKHYAHYIHNGYYFQCYKNAQNCLIELEPLLIMARLVG